MSKDKVVRLRHTIRHGDWRMYFYDGELPVVDSTLTIPASRPEWIQRAWIMGFRMTADGRVIADLAKHIRAETGGEEPVEPERRRKKVEVPDPVENPVPCCPDCECVAPCCEEAGVATEEACTCATPVEETETAESGEENDSEGTATGGQPAGDDGVRSSEPDRDGSLPEGGVDGRDGDEPAARGEGD